MRHLLVVSAAVLAVLGLHALPALAQEQAPKFSVKDDEARTGSKFRRNVVQSESIPLNLPYDKLSEAQKAEIKSVYEQMGPDDEPPFPEAGLGAMMNEITKAAGILQVQGHLRLHAHVDATGKVGSVALVNSVDEQLDLYAAGVLTRTKFKPAKCAGRPCSQEFLLALRLSLER